MAKVWKVIFIVFALTLLLGAVSIGVGYITGGDFQRIDNVFRAINEADIEYVQMIIENIDSTVRSIIDSLTAAA